MVLDILINRKVTPATLLGCIIIFIYSTDTIVSVEIHLASMVKIPMVVQNAAPVIIHKNVGLHLEILSIKLHQV